MRAVVVSGIRVAVVSAALLLVPLLPTAQADPNVKWFYSPSGNIECQVQYQREADSPDSAYCVSYEPPQHVSMDIDGELTLCTGETCLSNGPTDSFELPFTQSTRVGPFTCLSEVSGMTCTVESGRGFTISRSGITAVG